MKQGYWLAIGMLVGFSLATTCAWGNGGALPATRQPKQPTHAEAPPDEPILLDVQAVEEAPVNVALEQATLREIVLALAPTGWKVTIDSARPEIKEGRWNFYTSTQRREALADLLSPLNLTYRLFPDFKDKAGNPAPLLLVGDTHITGEVEYNDYE